MDDKSLFALAPKLCYHALRFQINAFELSKDTQPDWVMFAVEEGSFAYEAGNVCGVAGKGEIVICPPGTVFRRRVLTTLTCHFILFQWESALSDAEIESLVPVGSIGFTAEKRFANTLSLLREEAKTDGRSPTPWNDHLLRDIWFLYCAEHTFGNRLDAITAEDPQIYEALSYFRLHFSENIGVADASRHIHLSPVHFTRKFKAETGLTPTDYLASLRLFKARALLTETNRPLAQIARLCGYENEFYFGRVFKQKFGITPGTFRRERKLI